MYLFSKIKIYSIILFTFLSIESLPSKCISDLVGISKSDAIPVKFFTAVYFKMGTQFLK